MVNVLHRTTSSIKPNPAILFPNGTAKFLILVNDSSSSPTVPIGTVSWSDGNAGGIFNVTSCTLSSGTCAALYTASGNPPNVITINATYSGDNTHSITSTVSTLSTNVSYTTTTKVTPNPATFVAGNPVVFTADVADTSNPYDSLIGLVSWSDNGAGGTFNQNGCALSENHCSLTYSPPSNPSNTITIVASYAGDSDHLGSSGTSSLLVTGSTQTSQSIPTSNQSTNNVIIPQWIRSNAKFWHDNSIGDSDFEKGIQYLIQKGIMKIPPTQSETGNGTNKQIPPWVKNDAGWWASGQISDDEFVKGIQYLIQQGIIIV